MHVEAWRDLRTEGAGEFFRAGIQVLQCVLHTEEELGAIITDGIIPIRGVLVCLNDICAMAKEVLGDGCDNSGTVRTLHQ